VRLLVLLTDLFDSFGGIQTFNRCLVKALDEIARKNGWKITLLVLNDTRRNHNAHRYFDSQTTKYRPFNGRRARFVAATLRESRTASLAIIGHVHFTPLCLAISLLGRSIRILVVVYGTEVWKRLPILQRRGLARADEILSISAYTRDRMTIHNNLDPGRFEILPCCLDPFYGYGTGIKSREELSLPAGRMILSVARLEASEQKGIDHVIKALPKVMQSVPDVFLVVLGDGSDRPRLERLASIEGVRKRVIFAGMVSDENLHAYYRACDVFALPSLLEGFGIVFLEAMYVGKPCIGVRAGAVPEVIEDQQTGIIADPSNTEAIAEAIARLLTDEALAQAMADAGKKRVDQSFSFRVFRERVEAQVLRAGEERTPTDYTSTLRRDLIRDENSAVR